jgi:hypothetical protein
VIGRCRIGSLGILGAGGAGLLGGSWLGLDICAAGLSFVRRLFAGVARPVLYLDILLRFKYVLPSVFDVTYRADFYH